ncbi:hypothetical protein PE067_06265 [Paracoccus sp. DMF-8]|uniref:hypothetical protein n=1 Tax=Paracoccus sp. DMF-8 TaxID=3019445 RepID=UPI0023E85D19|nr:hypothetical protein [Paracoccus sp. DMF-8]MDF3605783.1 hypothetical protein [Paracoccus sp. DMF-8]
MDRKFATELRLLIDHLATRGVAMLSVRQGDERLRITLDAGIAPQAQVQPVTIAAAGPGIFHARHPGGADLACIEAGDFLFSVATIGEGDEILEQHSAVVGFGTPLIRRKGKT